MLLRDEVTRPGSVDASAAKARSKALTGSVARVSQRWALALLAATTPFLHRAEVDLGPGDSPIVTAEGSNAMTEEERVRRQKWLARGVTVFVVMSVDEDFREWREREGAGFEQTVREAIAALNVLCDHERTGPWVSHEARTRMREQLARMQALVDAGGVTDEVRQIARAVVEAIFPDAEQWFEENPGSATYSPAPRKSGDT